MTNPYDDNLPETPAWPRSEPADAGDVQQSGSAEKPVEQQSPGPLSPLTDPVPVLHRGALESGQEEPLFHSYIEAPERRPVRIPHFGHLLLLILLILGAFGVVLIGLFVAAYFHVFGLQISTASAGDLKFSLLSEGALYLITFAFCLVVFPKVWEESYFAGLHWRASVVRSRFWLLAGIAVACFVLAVIDQAAMPGPPDAPIEKMMSSPGASWLMFAFGISAAPFFEEMFFRGFLLPALATAYDWVVENLNHTAPRPLGADGQPQWSLPAMVVASIATSLPFALLHVAQQGHSLGPFILIILVSLILCAVRLITRSLAASTAVHAIYNFFIFVIELIGTGGFRHFENLK